MKLIYNFTMTWYVLQLKPFFAALVYFSLLQLRHLFCCSCLHMHILTREGENIEERERWKFSKKWDRKSGKLSSTELLLKSKNQTCGCRDVPRGGPRGPGTPGPKKKFGPTAQRKKGNFLYWLYFFISRDATPSLKNLNHIPFN